ncbi:hypothetical protein CIK06_15290 [Plantactinospora sp. KBS50]|nr:hypothetical protein CIK06_15290 [Plantactinospora sp. KBS50]
MDAVEVAARRLAVTRLALIREIDGRDVARAEGASSTTAWLRDRLRISGTAARRLVTDATWLDGDDPHTGTGPAGGLPADGPDATATAAASGVTTIATTTADVAARSAADVAARSAAAAAVAGAGVHGPVPPDPTPGDGAADSEPAADSGAPGSGAPGSGAAGCSAAGCGPTTAGPVLRAALRTGTISLEQARTIATAVTATRAEAGNQVADKALHALLGHARELTPEALRLCADRILWHIAPEAAEEADRRALHRADQHAQLRRHLALSTTAEGWIRLRGTLDPETSATLITALDPLTQPNGPGDNRTPGQRRHDALTEILQLALRTGDLPHNGGDATQLVVTTNLDTITGQLHAGTLDTGHRLAPEAVRRLACDATVLPAVLGTQSQILDLGRQRRLITGPLRRALILRDKGCAFPGCDRPPRWCHAHHIHHWADGGTTTLHNAVLLCRHHHRVIHHGDWTVHLNPDGHPEFTPPTWIDPRRLPRRNHYHLRC